ncbi:MAG: TonB-dependent receptor family protein, partial [Bacteroidales bacterium]|nr:TonB-dependent receptor family protein [Bacteroidales bacterium]
SIKYAHLNTGFNWQIADNHFTGMKVDLGSEYSFYAKSIIKNDIFLDNVFQDHLESTTIDRTGSKRPNTLGLNAYYNGNVGNLNIDFNVDYYGSLSSVHSTSDEISSIGDNASIVSDNEGNNKLYAAKLALSYPIGQGMFQMGTEETFSRTKSNYTISGAAIPSSSSAVKEDNLAAFASYGFMLGQVAQASAGLRYEHVNYAYENYLGDDDFTRRYDNLFPTLSIAGVLGPVQASLSYSAKTSRPDFESLNETFRYNNRYLLQSGNAKLQPQILQNLSLSAMIGVFAFQADYARVNSAILRWCEPYDNQGVILSHYVNLDKPMYAYSAYVVATPTIGVWNINYAVGLQGERLTLDLKDPTQPSGQRTLSCNGKPIWIAQLQNTFSLNKGWQIELGGICRSKGYSDVYYIYNSYVSLNAAVQKTLLKDGSLVIRLAGADLLGQEANNAFGDFGSYKIWQTNIRDTQKITLSVRYRFNSAQSKYKGTGAGSDAKARMQ